jgi:hypothetical protein
MPSRREGLGRRTRPTCECPKRRRRRWRLRWWGGSRGQSRGSRRFVGLLESRVSWGERASKPGRPTMQKRELELCKLLLGHRNPHFTVSLLAVFSPPAYAFLPPLALDERLERGRDSPVNESMQSLIDAAARCTAGGCRGQRRGGCGSEEVEKVELSREREGGVEGWDVFNEGEGGGLVRRVREGRGEVVSERVGCIVVW